MQPSTLAIPIAFIVLGAILLWCLIFTKGKWPIKLFLIITVPAFSVAVWNALDSYLGWPATDSVPEKSILLWGEVYEPNPQSGDPGKVCVWLIAYDDLAQNNSPFKYSPEKNEPRAYRLPYSRKLHEQLEQAKKMIKGGKTVFMKRERPAAGKGKPGGPGAEGKGKKGANSDKAGTGQRRSEERRVGKECRL